MPFSYVNPFLRFINAVKTFTEIASRPGLTQPAVSIASRRGEEIAKQKGYSLFEK